MFKKIGILVLLLGGISFNLPAFPPRLANAAESDGNFCVGTALGVDVLNGTVCLDFEAYYLSVIKLGGGMRFGVMVFPQFKLDNYTFDVRYSLDLPGAQYWQSTIPVIARIGSFNMKGDFGGDFGAGLAIGFTRYALPLGMNGNDVLVVDPPQSADAFLTISGLVELDFTAGKLFLPIKVVSDLEMSMGKPSSGGSYYYVYY